MGSSNHAAANVDNHKAIAINHHTNYQGISSNHVELTSVNVNLGNNSGAAGGNGVQLFNKSKDFSLV